MATIQETKIGANIVRAWFRTVINLLINMLEVQESNLQRHNWLFDEDEQSLALRPLEQWIPRKYLPNFYHIVEFYPDIKLLSDQHEEARVYLRDKCKILFNTLLAAPELRKKVQKIRENGVQGSLSTVQQESIHHFMRSSDEDICRLLAENLVNHLQKASPMRIDYRFWECYRDDFLPILSEGSIQALEKQTLEAGESLLAVVKQLLERLKDIRRVLSHQHDVPFVDYAS